MSSLDKLRSVFSVNWGTILAGWRGLGPFSPWPDRVDDFPALLTLDEIVDYATNKLASSLDTTEEQQVVELLSLDPHVATRQEVQRVLSRLARSDGSDPTIEIRKWRLVLLDTLLDKLPDDTVGALMALTEFWQDFGFPDDMPHEVQGMGNNIDPSTYFQPDTLERLICEHREWLARERATLIADNRGA